MRNNNFRGIGISIPPEKGRWHNMKGKIILFSNDVCVTTKLNNGDKIPTGIFKGTIYGENFSRRQGGIILYTYTVYNCALYTSQYYIYILSIAKAIESILYIYIRDIIVK